MRRTCGLNVVSRLPIVILAVGLGATGIGAQELVNNWNSAACGFTDTATLAVAQPGHLSRIELWYNWQPNENSVGYTVLFNGQEIGKGNLSRAGCDPKQGAWCVAQDTPDTDISPGTYTFRTERARVCQNGGSGGQGFIRAFAN